MAAAMRLAVEAGRAAHEAGRIERRWHGALASSPVAGKVGAAYQRASACEPLRYRQVRPLTRFPAS